MNLSPSVPLIGTPVVKGATTIVLILCTCDTHPPMMAVVGGEVIVCAVCQRAWALTGELTMHITPVIHGGTA